MNQQYVLQEVSKYLSRFKEQVKIQNKNSEFSINIHAENVLIDIFNVIYDVDLVNLNYQEGKNYDSIDLGDRSGKIAIQVTSTKKIGKIKDTLLKYKKNKHYENYEEVYIFILVGRQEKYSTKSLDKIIENKFTFDQAIHIVDFPILYTKLNEINNFEKTLKVLNLLKEQFSDFRVDKPVEIKPSDFFIKGASGIEISCKQAERGSEYLLCFPVDIIAPKKITVRFEQVGLAFRVVFEENVTVQLPVSFDIGLESGDGEYFFPKNTNEYFIGQYDFDDDGIDEIIIAVKDEVLSDNAIQVNVFKYYPPARQEHVYRKENWELMGNFLGGLMFPCEAKITDNSVRMDRNHRGFYYEWTCVKGRFINTGDY